MLKRIFVGVLVIVAIASAFPAIGGSKGFYRVTDTKTDGYGMLSLSLHNTFRRSTVDTSDWYQFAIRGGVTYAPLDWMEFWVSPTYAIWSSDFGFSGFAWAKAMSQGMASVSVIAASQMVLGIRMVGFPYYNR